MTELKLYRVSVEMELYCLACGENEAVAIAAGEFINEEPGLHATEVTKASQLYNEWPDALPYHRQKDVPERTCKEWLEQLKRQDHPE